MRRKLKAYCFQDRALDFLRSYLCNRSGRVHIGSVISSWRNMERGFPQESVLGQLLRNIFQNELSYNVDSALSMYVDDHQIYEKGQDVYCTGETSGECHPSNSLVWYESPSGKPGKKNQTMSIRNKSVNCGEKMCRIDNGRGIMESENLKLLGVTIDDEVIELIEVVRELEWSWG